MKHFPLARLLVVQAVTLAAIAMLGAGLARAAAPSVVAATPLFVKADADGLVGYWKFDEGAGLRASGFPSSSISGTLVNGASFISSTLPPVDFFNPHALALDGSNDRVDIADNAALDVAFSFSFAAWVRRTTANTFDAIYDSGDQANEWWVFIADSTSGKDNKFGFGARGITETYSTQAITDTNWHHLAVTKNGNGPSNVFFYVDGVQKGTASVGSVITPSGPKYLGALFDSGFSSQFAGDLDDVRLYNRALTPSEVARLANGRGCATSGTSWALAIPDLRCALDTASPNNEIWVAAGIYKPGVSRQATFSLTNGVPVYGGFNGTESALNQRPVFHSSNPLTRLSGDLLDNDAPNDFSRHGDNSIHVVSASGLTSSLTLLDGLGIEGGNATGAVVIEGSGGGLSVASSQLTLNNIAFTHNRTDHLGGGFFSILSSMVLSGVVAEHNAAQLGGGGLSDDDGLFSVRRSTFFSNTATSTGGGLSVNSSAPALITDVDFIANTAAHGGGLDISQQANLNGSRFLSNTASAVGGALQANSGVINISGTLFSGNQAGTSGGGVFAHAVSLSLQNARLAGNLADNGGGLYLTGTNGSLISVTLDANQAVTDGGGYLSDGSNSQLTGLNVLSNTAGGRGGGMFLFHDSGFQILRGGTVRANAAGNNGGGIYTEQDVLILFQMQVLSNTSGLLGGGLFVEGGTVNLYDDVFAINRATLGAGVVNRGTMQLLNVTLAGNRGSPGAALRSELGGVTTISNSLIFSNTGINPLSIQNGAQISATYSLVEGGFAGLGNINADPKFVRKPNGLLGDPGDLHLQLTSPAIDAGDAHDFNLVGDFDADGNPRLCDVPSVPDTGLGHPFVVDMGAYEAQGLCRALFLPLIVR